MRIFISSIRNDYDEGLSIDGTGTVFEIPSRAALIQFLLDYVRVYQYEKLLNNENGRYVALQTPGRKRSVETTTLVWIQQAGAGYMSVHEPGTDLEQRIRPPMFLASNVDALADVRAYLDKILPVEEILCPPM